MPDSPKVFIVGEVPKKPARNAEIIEGEKPEPARLYIVQGSTDEGAAALPYIGVACGKTEYRLYEDREGWFVQGLYTPTAPRYSARIAQAIERAGREAFHRARLGELPIWKLKELAEI